MFKQMKKLVLEKAKGDDHVVKSSMDFKESSDKDEKAKDIMRCTYTITADAANWQSMPERNMQVTVPMLSIKVVFKAQLVSEKEAAKFVKAKNVVLGYKAKRRNRFF